MDAQGFEIPCPEAGVSRERCLDGCGSCSIAQELHRKFREILASKSVIVFPTIAKQANTELRTTAIVGEHKTAILVHWDSVNGGGTRGKILFRYPAVSNSSVTVSEFKQLLLNP